MFNAFFKNVVEVVSDTVTDNVREIDFFYLSDNLRVRGRLYIHENPTPPLPLLVLNHGGIQGVYEGLKLIAEELVRDNGFVVFTPSYRGEDGSEGEVELAAGEVDDVINGVKILLKSNLIDPDRIFMVGSSHGALITLMAMSRDEENLIKKGVFCYGVSNLFKWFDYLESNDMRDDMQVAISAYPGLPHENPEFYHKRNGVEYVGKIKAPLLIIQGEDDKLVPPEQAYFLKQAADDAGIKDVKLVMFPDATHGMITRRIVTPDGEKIRSPECDESWKVILEFLDS